MKKGIEKIDSFKDKIVVFLVIYTIGLLLAILLKLFKALGIIKIPHWEHFPRYRDNPELYKNGLIVVSNHPSFLEPVLLSALFDRDYLFHPLKLSPWNTPDKTNYYDPWYWFWLRPRAIPIDRNNQRQRARALVLIKRILISGGIVILFPEGGRTFKGSDFYYSKEGKRIRTLKEGIGLLIEKTNALVLPIWVDGAEEFLPNLPDRSNRLYGTFPRFWKGVTIKVGGYLRFENPISREKISEKLIIALLKLADKPC